MPIEKIKEALRDRNIHKSSLHALIINLDHFEIARRLHELSEEEKIKIFHLLSDDFKRQELLYETDIDSRLEIQKSLDQNSLATLLDNMPEDEATDIIQELPGNTQEELLSKMGVQDAKVIKDLIRYEEETAGGLMSPDFNKVYLDSKASEIITKIRKDCIKLEF